MVARPRPKSLLGVVQTLEGLAIAVGRNSNKTQQRSRTCGEAPSSSIQGSNRRSKLWEERTAPWLPCRSENSCRRGEESMTNQTIQNQTANAQRK